VHNVYPIEALALYVIFHIYWATQAFVINVFLDIKGLMASAPNLEDVRQVLLGMGFKFV